MRTEILPRNEIPAMTADHMRKMIVAAYKAYETSDRQALEPLIANEFSFTSPYDDAIDREAYFARCWPNNETTARMEVERIFIEGDAAFITYVSTNVQGRSFRNTEYMTFSGGKVASVNVYLGAEYRDGAFLPASIRHPNRTEAPQQPTAS